MTLRWVTVAMAVGLLAACTTGTGANGTAPTTTGAPTPAASTVDGAMLLDSAEMPAWNNAGSWVVIDDTEAVRACELPTAQQVGASVAISRSFEYVVKLAPDETADPDAVPLLGINTVAAYPDDAAATGAVDAWVDALEACGALQLGSVPGGTTWTFSAQDEASRDNSWFDFVGVAAQGRTTTLVGFSVYGQDANAEGDPLATSMEASLARLP